MSVTGEGGERVCVRGVRQRGTVARWGVGDESAPENDTLKINTLGVWAAGQVHGRCYRMRMLDQINALLAVADGGEVWGTWEYGFAGQLRGQG